MEERPLQPGEAREHAGVSFIRRWLARDESIDLSKAKEATQHRVEGEVNELLGTLEAERKGGYHLTEVQVSVGDLSTGQYRGRYSRFAGHLNARLLAVNCALSRMSQPPGRRHDHVAIHSCSYTRSPTSAYADDPRLRLSQITWRTCRTSIDGGRGPHTRLPSRVGEDFLYVFKGARSAPGPG